MLAVLPAEQQPVAVAIDILDEDHSLRLAMKRLAEDAELRQALGSAAQSVLDAGTLTRGDARGLPSADGRRPRDAGAEGIAAGASRRRWYAASAAAGCAVWNRRAARVNEVNFDDPPERRTARARRPDHHQRFARSARHRLATRRRGAQPAHRQARSVWGHDAFRRTMRSRSSTLLGVARTEKGTVT